jgi:hypothetical protein
MSQPLLKQPFTKVAISTEEQIKFYENRIVELKEQHAQEQEEAVNIEAELLQKVAAFGYKVIPIDASTSLSDRTSTGTPAAPLNDQEEEYEPQAWYYDVIDWVRSISLTKSISSSKGMWTMVTTVALLTLGFAWWPVFLKLNESEVRIHNAATMHFLSHTLMGMSVLILGFGFQYLAFNQHFQYMWTSIKTEHSASEDFSSPSAEGKVRLLTAFFTWAFPVWIITQMFQFILG